MRASWLIAEIQLCMVHLVRAAVKHTSKKDSSRVSGRCAISTTPLQWRPQRRASIVLGSTRR